MIWNRGDDMPTNEVTLVMRGSASSIFLSESAAALVSFNEAEASKRISMAKLSRSALGRICMLTAANSSTPATTEAAPTASVIFL